MCVWGWGNIGVRVRAFILLCIRVCVCVCLLTFMYTQVCAWRCGCVQVKECVCLRVRGELPSNDPDLSRCCCHCCCCRCLNSAVHLPSLLCLSLVPSCFVHLFALISSHLLLTLPLFFSPLFPLTPPNPPPFLSFFSFLSVLTHLFLLVWGHSFLLCSFHFS